MIVVELQKKVKVLQQRHRRHLEKLLGLENTVSQLRQNNLLNEERLQLLERVKSFHQLGAFHGKSYSFITEIHKLYIDFFFFFCCLRSCRHACRPVLQCRMLVRLWLSSMRKMTLHTCILHWTTRMKSCEDIISSICCPLCQKSNYMANPVKDKMLLVFKKKKRFPLTKWDLCRKCGIVFNRGWTLHKFRWLIWYHFECVFMGFLVSQAYPSFVSFSHSFIKYFC